MKPDINSSSVWLSSIYKIKNSLETNLCTQLEKHCSYSIVRTAHFEISCIKTYESSSLLPKAVASFHHLITLPQYTPQSPAICQALFPGREKTQRWTEFGQLLTVNFQKIMHYLAEQLAHKLSEDVNHVLCIFIFPEEPNRVLFVSQSQ